MQSAWGPSVFSLVTMIFKLIVKANRIRILGNFAFYKLMMIIVELAMHVLGAWKNRKRMFKIWQEDSKEIQPATYKKENEFARNVFMGICNRWSEYLKSGYEIFVRSQNVILKRSCFNSKKLKPLFYVPFVIFFPLWQPMVSDSTGLGTKKDENWKESEATKTAIKYQPVPAICIYSSKGGSTFQVKKFMIHGNTAITRCPYVHMHWILTHIRKFSHDPMRICLFWAKLCNKSFVDKRVTILYDHPVLK